MDEVSPVKRSRFPRRAAASSRRCAALRRSLCGISIQAL